MRIHKEGRNIILYTAVSLTLLNLILYKVASKTLLFYFVLALSIGILMLILNFFRSPKRKFTEDTRNRIIAPADGTVVVIEEVMENEYFHDKRMQVSIFMSLFNAHVNWIPCDGKIISVGHQKGRFMAAYLPKSSTENERSSIVIERDNKEQILVRQIAGAMAKRIVTYAQPEQECRINQQLGFIKFGSRVDIFLPMDAEIKVEMDQSVKGNKTVLAQLN